MPMAPPHDAPWQLQPVPARARLWLLALTVPLPVAATVGALALARDSLASNAILVVAGVAALTGAIWWVIDRSLRRHHIVIDTDGLQVATTFYKQNLRWNELQLDRARVVDLDERTGLRPLLKTNATALPGFQSGWFRMRNRGKAFVARAGGTRRLWLPTSCGFDLLLQPRQPRALLQRLRELAPGRARG